MAGKRNHSLADYVSNWKRVRLNAAAADSVGPESEAPTVGAIDSFSTKGGPNDVMLGGVASEGNNYGRNAQIDFGVIISGFASITLQLWTLVEETNTPLVNKGDPAAIVTAITMPSTGMWILVETKVLTASGWWVVSNLRPGLFKVRVSAVTGSGAITVLESHAA